MPELFTFGQHTWNIDKAQALLAVHSRKPKKVPVKSLTGTLGLIRIDKEHAETVDLKKPVILGWLYADGTWFNILIDGNHRVFKASQLKKKTINAYILTKEENYLVLEGPGRDRLHPDKTYIADYASKVTRKLPSRDDFYRDRVHEFLDSMDEENWKDEALNFKKLHETLIKRRSPAEPDKSKFVKLEKLIKTKTCPGAVTIDWIFFGGEHKKIKTRAYINLDPDSFDANNFCEFISWFTDELSQVAYAKIPSSMFHKRFYRDHDIFIIYTILEDEGEVSELLDSCAGKLQDLGFHFDSTPSEVYIQEEAEHSFHGDLAQLILEVMKECSQEAESFEEFFEKAYKAFDMEGLFTKKLVEKNLVL